MIIGAMGDAHGDKYFQAGMADRLDGIDLLLLAGDIADGNDIEKFAVVWNAIRARYRGRVIAVFGNDEYEQDRLRYRERFDATFLDDEAIDLEVDGRKVRIVGTTGSLDRPTWWQRTNVPEIWNRYRQRVAKVSTLLERGNSDLLILLSHYAPTYLTLRGEREKAFPEMGSQAMEKVLLERSPDLAIHSHAHSGTSHAVLRDVQGRLDRPAVSVPVWNVSLPLNKEIVRLELNGKVKDDDMQH